MFKNDESEKKTIAILRVLKEAQQPLGARVIARRIENYGVNLSERTVRYHLQFMDERGLTELVGRRDGRLITRHGIDELGNARVQDKVGLTLTRIERLAYRTTFDPETLSGLIPVNISCFPRAQALSALATMKPAFDQGMCASPLVAMARPGEQLGDITIPEDHLGIATVCSVVVNGVLLKHGIPMNAKFGGILQVRDRQPVRFVELIHYSGSSLDPSEAFIAAHMTDARATLTTPNGKMLANFRDIPGICLADTRDILESLDHTHISPSLAIGTIGEPVCQVPVDEGKAGIILTGGLNPVACAHEAGYAAEIHSMSTMMAYDELRHFDELYREYRQ